MKNLFLFLFLLVVFTSKAQDNRVSGLNSRQFTKYWKVESESPDYKVTFQGDTAEIVSPKGLTLWRKEKMSGKVTIEYDACVVVESDGDRLSDLNCFWMASDPQYPDNLWKREKWRSGIFLNCYSLQLYYLGYGGNHNSTTRFRRYDGDESGITNPKARPAILKEYTDAGHLLKPNHWYHIKITNENNRVSYYIDGERLVDPSRTPPKKHRKRRKKKRNPASRVLKRKRLPKRKQSPNNRQNRFAPSARKEISCEAKQLTVVPNIRMVVHSGWIMRLMGKGYRMRNWQRSSEICNDTVIYHYSVLSLARPLQLPCLPRLGCSRSSFNKTFTFLAPALSPAREKEAISIFASSVIINVYFINLVIPSEVQGSIPQPHHSPSASLISGNEQDLPD